MTEKIDVDTFIWVTQETLMERIQDPNDETSWEEFANYYEQYIYNIIRSTGLNHHDSIEVKQLVMIKLWKKIPELEKGYISGKFRNWLYSVVKNQIRDFIKQRARWSRRKENAGKHADYLESIELPETDEIATKEWHEHLAQLCWNKVINDFQQHILDAFQDMMAGLPVEEIAKKYDISKSSVYVYKKRVSDRLRRYYMQLSNTI